MASIAEQTNIGGVEPLRFVPGGSGEPAPGPEDFKTEIEELGGGAMIEDESVEFKKDLERIDKRAGLKDQDFDAGNDTDTPTGAGLPHPLGGARTRD